MDALLDRDAELAELGRRLAAARAGAGRVIVVEGPAGIGKSRLLAAASQAACTDGATVLRAVCSPLEQQAAWGKLHITARAQLPNALKPQNRAAEAALAR